MILIITYSIRCSGWRSSQYLPMSDSTEDDTFKTLFGSDSDNGLGLFSDLGPADANSYTLDNTRPPSLENASQNSYTLDNTSPSLENASQNSYTTFQVDNVAHMHNPYSIDTPQNPYTVTTPHNPYSIDNTPQNLYTVTTPHNPYNTPHNLYSVYNAPQNPYSVDNAIDNAPQNPYTVVGHMSQNPFVVDNANFSRTVSAPTMFFGLF
jgi:hypothetical protein